MNNVEDYVTFEQSVKLKKLGFDWECDHVYYGENVNYVFTSERKRNYNTEDYRFSVPTLSQVQKWLRDVKGVIICIEPRFYKNKKPLVGYDYHIFDKDNGWYSHVESKTVYDTYEQSLTSGIDKVLEILK